MAKAERVEMLDIAEVETAVEIESDGRMVWVNVDGICRLRIRLPHGFLERRSGAGHLSKTSFEREF
jgi:hypothetical protein